MTARVQVPAFEIEVEIDGVALPPVDPPQLTLTLSRATVEVGGALSLSWSTVGATLVQIGVVDKPASGSMALDTSVGGTWDVIATAIGPGGEKTKSVSYTVTAAPPVDPPPTGTGPSIEITLAPLPLRVGQQSYLDWVLTNVAALEFDNAGSGLAPRALTATRQGVKPGSTGLKRFAWRLTGTDGSVTTITREWTALAAGEPDPGTEPPDDPNEPPLPTISLSVAPAVFLQGEPVTLRWSVENAEVVTINEGVGEVPLSGERIVTPIGTTTYVLLAKGPNGQATRSVKAEYLPPPINGETVHVATDEASFRKLVGDSSPAQAGDEIKVQDMELAGSFQLRIEGTEAKPITVRTINGPKGVHCDGLAPVSAACFDVGGSWYDFVGFYVDSSSNGPRQIGQDGPHNGGVILRPDAFYAYGTRPGGHGVRIIDCVIRNTRQGIAIGDGKEPFEALWCYTAQTGWLGGDRPHGPGTYFKGSSVPTRANRVRECFSDRTFYDGPRYVGSGESNSPYNCELIDNVVWGCGECEYDVNGIPSRQLPACFVDVQKAGLTTALIRGMWAIAAVPFKDAGAWYERHWLDGWNLAFSVSGSPKWKDRIVCEQNLVIGSDELGAALSAKGYNHMVIRDNEIISKPNANLLEYDGTNASTQTREWSGNIWRGGRGDRVRYNGLYQAWDTAKYGAHDPVIPTEGYRFKFMRHPFEPQRILRAAVINFGLTPHIPLDVSPYLPSGKACKVWNLENWIYRDRADMKVKFGAPIWQGVIPDDGVIPVPATLSGPYPLPTGSALPLGAQKMKTMSPFFLPLHIEVE